MKQIKRFGVLQTAKVAGAVYLAVGIVVFVAFVVFAKFPVFFVLFALAALGYAIYNMYVDHSNLLKLIHEL